MPMTVKVGLTRKLGQPEFGSLGASCDVQLELEGSLLFADPDALQDKIRSAYAACDRAITAELSRQTSQETPYPANGTTNGHGPVNGNGRTNGASQNGSSGSNGHQRKATTSQLRALHAIANRQGLKLADVLRDRFRVYKAEDLSVGEASQMIDELKGTPTGATDGAGGRG